MVILQPVSYTHLDVYKRQVFTLYSPRVYETADIIDTFVYRISLVEANYSLGTAVGLLKSVVSFLLIVSSYKLANKYSDYTIF